MASSSERTELESQWPASLWPVSAAFLESLPEDFRPNDKLLREFLNRPWDLFTYLQSELELKMYSTQVLSDLVSPDARIRGPVFIEKGARIFDFATIVGPAYIAAGALIGQYANVRGSYVGPGTNVGVRSEVVRSILGSSCELHNTYVGDSLLGNGVHVSGEAGTANFRTNQAEIFSRIGDKRLNTGLIKLGAIIGDHTELATGVSSMPGVKVGSHAILGPNVTIYDDVSDWQYVRNPRVELKVTDIPQP